MPKRDPQIDAHLEWIGFVRPTGLVVSAPALVRAGAVLPRDPEGQRRLRACVAERRFRPDGEPEPWLPDFRAFAASVLGWSFLPKGYAGTDDSPIPPELETPLREGGEVLRPDFVARERDPRDDWGAYIGGKLRVGVLGVWTSDGERRLLQTKLRDWAHAHRRVRRRRGAGAGVGPGAVRVRGESACSGSRRV